MHKRTLLLLVLVALMGPAGSRAAAGGVPDGLGTSDWNSIRAEYERQRQAVFPVEGGHRARNFAQQWVSEFDGRGFLVTPDSGGWKWGLRLESYGWAGRAQAVTERPRVTAETERVNYDWDETLREWYVNDGRGLEHGFTLWQPPAGRGETLELNGLPVPSAPYSILSDWKSLNKLYARDVQKRIDYSRAIWIDWEAKS